MKNLRNFLIEHCKSEGKKLVDIKKELLGLALSLYDTESLDSTWGKDYDLEDQRHKDLYGFHKKIVQETIDFISENPEIKKLIESKRKEISEKIKEESGFEYVPDLRVYFGVDGLENSIEFGEWTPATDSSLGIYLGNVKILWSM